MMSSVELGKAKAEYLTARARLERDQKAYEREKNLHEKKISSEADLLAAKAEYEHARAHVQAAKETLRLFGLDQEEIDQIQAGGENPLCDLELASTIEGSGQKRDLSTGQTLTSNGTPINLATPTQLWVMINAFERCAPLLSPGQNVELDVRSLPGRTFKGKTDWVSYALDPKTRTIRVRAIIQNPDLALRAGMFGTARIYTGQEIQNALIPIDAVQTVEDRKVAFVPGEEPGSFRAVDVRLGNETDGYAEVLSGLKPEDRAVTSGAFHLKSILTARTRSAAHHH
jgi:cobalt-zinc-cadmium efflux system membrane fusion protein